MGQHFQDVYQNVQYNTNSCTVEAHFAQNVDQKPTPQRCREITKLQIISKVNPSRLIKTWVESLCK